jgi:YegS/Rv2252/BmrU family lipid kinase
MGQSPLRFRFLYAILNPASGRGKGRKIGEKVRQLLERPGVQLQWKETEYPGHATELARQAPEECECIVAVGGDGTVNEVVNGLVGSGKVLGVIPIGSGNDFARALRLPSNYRKAIDVLWEGQVKTIDLGWVNGRYYPNALGLGFDAQVVHESNRIRRLRGMLIYLYGVIKTVFKFRPFRIRIKLDGKELEKREILMMTVANGISVGGGFLLTPQARNDDGLFDVCIIHKMPKPLIFWHLPKVFWGGHVNLPYTSMFRAKHVVVNAETPLGAHVDGELLGIDDHFYEAKIIPSALKVVWNARSES